MMKTVFHNATAGHPLTRSGVEELRARMQEEYAVKSKDGSLPTLSLKPCEFLRFILTRVTLGPEGPRSSGVDQARLEVHGGVANSVSDADDDMECRRRPTDLDARFVLPRSAGVSFEECRDIVEEYLMLKLSTKLGDFSNLDHEVSPQAVRHAYFIKHVLISDNMSLLSIGDAASGKNIDIEFVLSGCEPRLHFDDAHSCVIPLSLAGLAELLDITPGSVQDVGGDSEHSDDCSSSSGASTEISTANTRKATATTSANPMPSGLYAFSLCGDYSKMRACRRNKVLSVIAPEQVSNGLPLLLHTVLVRGFVPEDSVAISRHFANAFAAEATHSARYGRDGTGYLDSFIRSHYPHQHTQAIAIVASMLVHLAVFADPSVDIEIPAQALSQMLVRLAIALLEATDGASSEGAADMHALLKTMQYIQQPALGRTGTSLDRASLPLEELPSSVGAAFLWRHHPSVLLDSMGMHRLYTIGTYVLHSIRAAVTDSLPSRVAAGFHAAQFVLESHLQLCEHDNSNQGVADEVFCHSVDSEKTKEEPKVSHAYRSALLSNPVSSKPATEASEPPSRVRLRRLEAGELQEQLQRGVWALWAYLRDGNDVELAYAWLFEGGLISMLAPSQRRECERELLALESDDDVCSASDAQPDSVSEASPATSDSDLTDDEDTRTNSRMDGTPSPPSSPPLRTSPSPSNWMRNIHSKMLQGVQHVFPSCGLSSLFGASGRGGGISRELQSRLGIMRSITHGRGAEAFWDDEAEFEVDRSCYTHPFVRV